MRSPLRSRSSHLSFAEMQACSVWQHPSLSDDVSEDDDRLFGYPLRRRVDPVRMKMVEVVCDVRLATGERFLGLACPPVDRASWMEADLQLVHTSKGRLFFRQLNLGTVEDLSGREVRTVIAREARGLRKPLARLFPLTMTPRARIVGWPATFTLDGFPAYTRTRGWHFVLG